MRPASSGWTPGIEGEGKRRWKFGNLALLIVFLLLASLLFLPAMEIVLEDPSKRGAALIVAFGILAAVLVIITFPRRRWEETVIDQYTVEESEQRAGNGRNKELSEVAAITDLRSVAVRRMQVRRRIDDKELRLLVKSPEELNVILEDELLEELVLEDPRFLVWKMKKGGDFQDAYERLLARVEAWR